MTKCFTPSRTMLGMSSRRFTFALHSDSSVSLPRICVSRCVFHLRPRVSVVTLTLSQGNTDNRSIINVSSISGLHGNVGQSNYAAAKAAVIGLTKTVAKEWGPFGVRANTIAFGLIQTRFVSGGSIGQYVPNALIG